MISIIDRYILREVIKSYLAILAVLLLIFTSNSFIRILQKAVSGTISNDVLFQLVALKSVDIFGTVIPPAFFFAVIYAIGRMYRDSEMTALASCGFGYRKVFRAISFAALPVALFLGFLTFWGMPMSEQVSQQIYERQKEEAEMSNAAAGRFNEFKDGQVLLFAEEMSKDKTKLENVFIQNRQHGELGLVTAVDGYQYVDKETGDTFMVLRNAHRYVGEPGDTEFSVGEMQEFGMRISESEEEEVIVSRKALSTSFLLGSDSLLHKSELQSRLLLPLSVFVFSIAGVILSRSMPREGTSGRIVLSILFYSVFLNLQALSHSWMRDAVTPAWIGRWWVFIVAMLLIWLFYFIRSESFHRVNKWVVQRLRK